MLKGGENKKIDKIEKLVEIIATNVLKLTEDMVEVKKDVKEVKKDVGELKESNKNIRKDILNLGDRFVSYHMFDQLASRVNVLEKKQK
ncbi:MAG: hypothetical protein AAB687_01825 [Patescibacteria group bacterium]